MKAPLVTDIARASTADGPGLRTVVFLKGCPLRCEWCHNPETQSMAKEMSFASGSCIRCGECRNVCPQDNPLSRKSCAGCEACSDACPTNSRRFIGDSISPRNLAEVILRDLSYYKASNGGVTFSGGEPLLYPEFISIVCGFLKPFGVHIAIQTSGQFNYQKYQELVEPAVQLIMFDLKFFDSKLHQKHTKLSNRLILSNFKMLSKSRVLLKPRIPLVPGLTDTDKNLKSLAVFLVQNNHLHADLLPFNSGGLQKLKCLGRETSARLSDYPASIFQEKKATRKFLSFLEEVQSKKRIMA